MLHSNADQIKFRCSGLGYIMSDGNKLTDKQLTYIAELQDKPKRTTKQDEDLASLIYRRDNPELARGVKTHLVDVFVSSKYGRREEITSKFLDKGNEREEDSLTLLSRIAKKFFKKNSERLDNKWIQGECDTFIGESIRKAKETLDTKTSWSAHTFFRAQKDALDKMYYWQGQGYMDLTGASKHTVAYCLVNGTPKGIIDEKRRLSYAMGIVDPEVNHPEFKKRCKQIEINHIFDIKAFREENPYFDFDNDPDAWKWDIPMQERLHLFEFDRNQRDIDRMHKRVEECREHMNNHLFKIAATVAA